MSQGRKKSWPDRDSNPGPLAIRETTELLSQWPTYDIHLVYHIIDFFQKLIFYAMGYVDQHGAKKSLTTRFVFHVALDKQVQVGINLHNFNVT